MSRSWSRSPSFLMTTASSAFAEEVSGIAIPKAASAAKAMANLRIEFSPTQQNAGYQNARRLNLFLLSRISILNICSFEIGPDTESSILGHVSAVGHSLPRGHAAHAFAALGS